MVERVVNGKVTLLSDACSDLGGRGKSSGSVDAGSAVNLFKKPGESDSVGRTGLCGGIFSLLLLLLLRLRGLGRLSRPLPAG